VARLDNKALRIAADGKNAVSDVSSWLDQRQTEMGLESEWKNIVDRAKKLDGESFLTQLLTDIEPECL
jgi:hypothetical protein